MNITKTKIPDILIIKPKKIFDKEVFFKKIGIAEYLKKKQDRRLILFKKTILTLKKE